MSNALDLRVKGTVSKFVTAIAKGEAQEIAIFGARGDRKTSGGFVGMIEHARLHAEAGFNLPVKWIGVADTFTSHKAKTIPSLQASYWKGAWRFEEDHHVAIFRAGGTDWVHIDLVGIEDQGAMDRVRKECHCVWFEEPAPAAVLVQSSGLSETSWLIAITSMRLPTHAHVAYLTSNYPDEDHWTWVRFIINKEPGTMYFRIPPGENASAKDREEWEKALASRPDLLKRLVSGEPGTIMLGAQVADGFREDRHISDVELSPIKGEPLFFSWDGGHTPTMLIGQEWRGRIRIYVSLTEERAGMRQLIKNQVIPWLSKYAPWVLEDARQMIHTYDPSIDTDENADIEQNPLRVIEALLGGEFSPGPVSWEGRKGPMLTIFRSTDSNGDQALQINRKGGDLLIKALSGRWYYPKDRLGKVSRDLPKKPNHPWEDLGDAFCYLVARIAPGTKKSDGRLVVQSGFSVFHSPADEVVQVESDFRV